MKVPGFIARNRAVHGDRVAVVFTVLLVVKDFH